MIQIHNGVEITYFHYIIQKYANLKQHYSIQFILFRSQSVVCIFQKAEVPVGGLLSKALLEYHSGNYNESHLKIPFTNF